MATKTAIITGMRWIERLSDPDNFNSEMMRVLQQQVTIFKYGLEEIYESYWEDVPLEKCDD